MKEQINPLAARITKALAHAENGDKIDVSNTKKGKTGEMKSIFQFEPDTWKQYSKEISGSELPMTPENEAAVTYKKVEAWLGKGYTPKQIASMWNAGSSEPNAYTGKFSNGKLSTGTNQKYKVGYDVSGYVNKFEKYLEKTGLPTAEASTMQASPSSSQQPAPALSSPAFSGQP